MKVSQFENLCHTYPGLEVNFSPFDCGSWRGVYAEPCIFIQEGISKMGDFLPFIEKLKSEEFYGYKGGVFFYDKNDPINFELDHSSWSDGETLERFLRENPKLAQVWTD